MAMEPMTPGDDPFGPTTEAVRSNDSPPYSAEFEDAVMRTVLSPPQASGIALLNDGEDVAENAQSALRSAVDASTLPNFSLSDLPLPLNHPSRVYQSTVPGVRYTHPGGSLEGGTGPGSNEPGTRTERARLVQDLIEENRIRKAANFWTVLEKERQDALQELEDRMQARQKAIKHNQDIEAQLVQMKEERDLVVRVWERKKGVGKG